MTFYLLDSDGKRIDLPACSGDWKPSAFWVFSCLHDPVGPICRRHKKFFKSRKEQQ